MIFREATVNDIQQIQVVRNAVKENRLSNPNLITDEACEEYILVRGKGWVCEINHQIVGFGIVDLKDNNIWALFLQPNFEKKGIGRKLHFIMLDWYFSQTQKAIWLGTDAGTRAEQFYRNAGWVEVGLAGKNEIKFEMSYENWLQRRKSLV